MDAKGIFDALLAKHGDAVSGLTVENVKDAFFKVKADAWPVVARTLKDDPTLRFDFLNCVTAVDWLKQGILQVVYHLYSYPLRHECVLKIDLDRAKPQVPSAVGIWKGANWQEREQYDLLGVEFIGHPDLRRLLLPDDWVGHPMRKDYKEAAEYRGMPTTRPSPMDLLAAFDKAVLAGTVGGATGEGGEGGQP